MMKSCACACRRSVHTQQDQVATNQTCRGNNIVKRRPLLAHRNVLVDRARKQIRCLLNDRNVLSQPLHVQTAQREENVALCSAQQTLAGCGRPASRSRCSDRTDALPVPAPSTCRRHCTLFTEQHTTCQHAHLGPTSASVSPARIVRLNLSRILSLGRAGYVKSTFCSTISPLICAGLIPVMHDHFTSDSHIQEQHTLVSERIHGRLAIDDLKDLCSCHTAVEDLVVCWNGLQLTEKN